MELAHLSEEVVKSLYRNRMSEREFEVVMDHLHMLPMLLTLAITESPFLRFMPYSLFKFPFNSGAYKEEDRIFGRLLWEEDRSLLQESVRNDMNFARESKHKTA